MSDDAEALPFDDEIPHQELRLDVFRASGPGGQSANTSDSAVRITHLRTGIVVEQGGSSSQIQNRALALQRLRELLLIRERRRVWLAWGGDTYGGYVAELDAGGREIGKLEDVPTSADLSEVLAWARQRAAKVVVRPSWDEGRHYWAGDAPPPRDTPLLPDVQDWPDDLFPSRDEPVSSMSWILRCQECGWCAYGDTKDEAQVGLLEHWAADHRRDAT